MICDTRAIINEQLKKTTISDYQMTRYTSMSKNDEIGGNLTLPQTKDALRKLRSEKKFIAVPHICATHSLDALQNLQVTYH